MKPTIVALLAAACLAVCAGPVTATPISYEEEWDTYALGIADPNYVANWPTIAGAQRYPVEDAANRQWSAPNSLGVGKDVKYGITHDLTADALPLGGEVVGTDANPLEVRIFIDTKATTDTDPRTEKMDAFLEISLGGAHAPDPNETGPADVIAFGFTYGINGASVHPYVFDGLDWIEATEVTSGKRWNELKLEITSTQLTLKGLQNADGNATIARNYTGSFDSISVRTHDNDDSGQKRWIDDILLTGGEVSGLVLGDLNGDGQVNNLDVDPFLGVLLNGPFDPRADMNQDDQVNGLDVDPFVATVLNGGGSTQSVPEPSTILLATIGLLVVWGQTRFSVFRVQDR